jgi:hypothetical protein
MFLIDFNTQSIMRFKSLIKANITSAKKSWVGGATSQIIRSDAPTWNSVRSNVRISDLL